MVLGPTKSTQNPASPDFLKGILTYLQKIPSEK